GIGKSNGEKETISHVLGRFTPQERTIIAEVLDLAIAAVEMSLTEGVEKAMSLFNARAVMNNE
ncbi:MAG: aminoacyl-tRNA hydrolase, partial [Cyanobacteriota bacterium]|nr:aminoacyl-tRNA hydrolase [Cyanobacteriota bacterium]